MSTQITAPFSREQVDKLNRYQRIDHFHPFTCGVCGAVLVATPGEVGWVCPNRDGFTQDWAWDWMTEAEGLPIYTPGEAG